MNKIAKALSVGDFVFTPFGKSQITRISNFGFYCGKVYFSYEEHGKNYVLHESSTERWNKKCSSQKKTTAALNVI